jgi:hypothetical protein
VNLQAAGQQEQREGGGERENTNGDDYCATQIFVVTSELCAAFGIGEDRTLPTENGVQNENHQTQAKGHILCGRSNGGVFGTRA